MSIKDFIITKLNMAHAINKTPYQVRYPLLESYLQAIITLSYKAHELKKLDHGYDFQEYVMGESMKLESKKRNLMIKLVELVNDYENRLGQESHTLLEKTARKTDYELFDLKSELENIDSRECKKIDLLRLYDSKRFDVTYKDIANRIDLSTLLSIRGLSIEETCYFKYKDIQKRAYQLARYREYVEGFDQLDHVELDNFGGFDNFVAHDYNDFCDGMIVLADSRLYHKMLSAANGFIDNAISPKGPSRNTFNKKRDILKDLVENFSYVPCRKVDKDHIAISYMELYDIVKLVRESNVSPVNHLIDDLIDDLSKAGVPLKLWKEGLVNPKLAEKYSYVDTLGKTHSYASLNMTYKKEKGE